MENILKQVGKVGKRASKKQKSALKEIYATFVAHLKSLQISPTAKKHVQFVQSLATDIQNIIIAISSNLDLMELASHEILRIINAISEYPKHLHSCGCKLVYSVQNLVLDQTVPKQIMKPWLTTLLKASYNPKTTVELRKASIELVLELISNCVENKAKLFEQRASLHHLVSTLLTAGDVELQGLIIELLFRLCPSNSDSRQCFLQSAFKAIQVPADFLNTPEDLVQRFKNISVSRFPADLREFLNYINSSWQTQDYSRITSLKCNVIEYHGLKSIEISPHCQVAENYWVDFNCSSISFLAEIEKELQSVIVPYCEISSWRFIPSTTVSAIKLFLKQTPSFDPGQPEVPVHFTFEFSNSDNNLNLKEMFDSISMFHGMSSSKVSVVSGVIDCAKSAIIPTTSDIHDLMKQAELLSQQLENEDFGDDFVSDKPESLHSEIKTRSSPRNIESLRTGKNLNESAILNDLDREVHAPKTYKRSHKPNLRRQQKMDVIDEEYKPFGSSPCSDFHQKHVFAAEKPVDNENKPENSSIGSDFAPPNQYVKQENTNNAVDSSEKHDTKSIIDPPGNIEHVDEGYKLKSSDQSSEFVPPSKKKNHNLKEDEEIKPQKKAKKSRWQPKKKRTDKKENLLFQDRSPPEKLVIKRELAKEQCSYEEKPEVKDSGFISFEKRKEVQISPITKEAMEVEQEISKEDILNSLKGNIPIQPVMVEKEKPPIENSYQCSTKQKSRKRGIISAVSLSPVSSSTEASSELELLQPEPLKKKVLPTVSDIFGGSPLRVRTENLFTDAGEFTVDEFNDAFQATSTPKKRKRTEVTNPLNVEPEEDNKIMTQGNIDQAFYEARKKLVRSHNQAVLDFDYLLTENLQEFKKDEDLRLVAYEKDIQTIMSQRYTGAIEMINKFRNHADKMQSMLQTFL